MSGKLIQKLLSKDPEFVAKFVTNPTSAMKEFGIEPQSLTDREANALEALVQQTQDNIRTNAKLVGVAVAQSDWGIGAGCCNAAKAFIGGLS
jgi:hypothetical protein